MCKHSHIVCGIRQDTIIGLNFLEMVSGTIITTPTCHAPINKPHPHATPQLINHTQITHTLTTRQTLGRPGLSTFRDQQYKLMKVLRDPGPCS